VRLSPTLEIVAGRSGKHLACVKCGFVLSPAGGPWKPHAALRERPLNTLADTYTTTGDLMLREFSCPRCHALLDSETALKGDPFLNDVVFVK
jgi:acetone carboxylase gamma subunit